MKILIKAFISKLFNLVGYNVTFSKKTISSDIVVDKNYWEPFYKPNHKMNLYFKGLRMSKVEWSDNYYKQLRFYNLQQMVDYALRQKLIGDFVECGVWKGHSAYIISSILYENKFAGNFYIFDALERGLSRKSGKDENLRSELTQQEIQVESNIFQSTEDEVKACLSEFDFIHLYKGWIPNRFIEVENKQFSFVHIDVDLYEPTRDSLNFFFPRLVENGVIVCDDYGLCQFPGAKKAVDEFLKKNIYKMFYKVPMGACFIIK